MPHNTGLLATICVGLVAAFIGGFVATRLRLPPIIGYLLAGVAVGPFTPGFVGDTEAATQLSEIGVILLMFGVGIHFSVRDLLAVRCIALPGAIGQIAIATVLGIGLTQLWGWSVAQGFAFGLAIGVASTVVLLRSLADYGALDSDAGRAAVGWLIVEDLFTVLVLVLLPVLAVPLGGTLAEDQAGGKNIFVTIAVALGRTVLFVLVLFGIGGRVVRWLLTQVARGGSQELFTLAVLATALGIAFGASVVFGVSLALGAFVAGLVVGESDLSHKAAADALPLRDAFAVLFFVSVGMLFDPAVLITSPGRVLGVVAVVILGKALAALAIVLLLRYPLRTGLIVAAGLAQIGEFSFILAELERSLDLLPADGQNLILAGALLSITLNPLLFRTITPIERWVAARPRLAALVDRGAVRAPCVAAVANEDAALRADVIVCGYGRVGSLVGHALQRRHVRYLVVEQDHAQVEALHKQGIAAVWGDAANTTFLAHLHLETARVLVVATGDRQVNHQIVHHARTVNPHIALVVRAHQHDELATLHDLGVSDAVMGEVELAHTMARRVLHWLGTVGTQAEATIAALHGTDNDDEAQLLEAAR